MNIKRTTMIKYRQQTANETTYCEAAVTADIPPVQQSQQRSHQKRHKYMSFITRSKRQIRSEKNSNPPVVPPNGQQLASVCCFVKATDISLHITCETCNSISLSRQMVMFKCNQQHHENGTVFQ